MRLGIPSGSLRWPSILLVCELDSHACSLEGGCDYHSCSSPNSCPPTLSLVMASSSPAWVQALEQQSTAYLWAAQAAREQGLLPLCQAYLKQCQDLRRLATPSRPPLPPPPRAQPPYPGSRTGGARPAVGAPAGCTVCLGHPRGWWLGCIPACVAKGGSAGLHQRPWPSLSGMSSGF